MIFLQNNFIIKKDLIKSWKITKTNRNYTKEIIKETNKINLFRLPKLVIWGIPIILGKCINERLYATALLYFFKNNGFTYMKIGQWLAMRSDIFPYHVCKKLAELHNMAPTHKIEETIKIIKNEINDSNLKITNNIPIGSGCVAQVYEGTYNGKRVAIKVLHPNIHKEIEEDLNLFSKITKFFIDPDFLLQFRIDVFNQINLETEHKNLKILRHNFANYKRIKIPQPYVSTKNVLIEEYIETTKINDLSINQSQKNKIIFICQNMFAKMIFRDRFIHGDLHSGNLLIDKKLNLVLFDTGICKLLLNHEYVNLLDLLYEALINKNYKKVGELIINRRENDQVIDCNKFIDSFGKETFIKKNYKNGLLLLKKHKVRLDFGYSTLLTSTVCLDGFLRKLSAIPYKDLKKTLYFYMPYTYYITKWMIHHFFN